MQGSLSKQKGDILMTEEFNGTINLDIRDSVPDWRPYTEPKAKEGSPNILYIVMDDTGFASWDIYGGKIKMPNLMRIAAKGLVYTSFHTTALCSPTRSSLLNGRNATSNGMSCIEEATAGFPGSNGRIPFENALLPEVLSERGYNTFALGKWHLLPEEEASMAASKRHWPVSRGFNRYYGFLGGESDQWYPDIIYDNHLIEPPYAPDMDDTENGYHLSKDLVDKAIMFIKDSQAIAPDKPWMMYFCPGATHAPHQIWPELIGPKDKGGYGYNTGYSAKEYTIGPDATEDAPASGSGAKANVSYTDYMEASEFGRGYEEYRDEVLERMNDMGIFDGDEGQTNVTGPTVINPHFEPGAEAPDDDTVNGVPDKPWPPTEFVKPWGDPDNDNSDEMAISERALYVRMAETYAAFSTYTDAQIGRLLDYLEIQDREEGKSQMDNTIVIVVSDNGSSGEGGPTGSVNENLFFNDIPDTLASNLPLINDLGTLKTYNHYPTGWAWAFDTPFKYWKRWSGYEGADATPFMICGPNIRAEEEEPGYTMPSPPYDGGVELCFRKQYVHAVDVVPTLYELLELEPPEVVKGYTQNPIEGISFAYTFAKAYAESTYQYPHSILNEEGLYGNGILKPVKPEKVRESQFYSMLGTRGIWSKGWFACTLHPPTPSNWSDFESDTWELYCMDGAAATLAGYDGSNHPDADPSQSLNLADSVYLDSLCQSDEPLRNALKQQLESMKNMWFLQAGVYKGLPLDDRTTGAVLGEVRPQLREPPFDDESEIEDTYSYTYYPGGTEVPEASAPNIRSRSYSITATIANVKDDGSSLTGVLFSQGGRFGGHSFYIHEGKLCYVHNWLGQQEQKASCSLTGLLTDVDEGTVLTLKVAFDIEERLDSDPESVDSNPDLSFSSDIEHGSSAVGAISLYFEADFEGVGEPTLQEGVSYRGCFEDYKDDHQFLTQPGKFSLVGEGLNIGRDAGQPVASDYDPTVNAQGEFVEGQTFEGAPFVGADIEKVVVTITNDALVPSETVGMLEETIGGGGGRDLGKKVKKSISQAILDRQAKKDRQAEKEYQGMMWRD
ncbi:MAG: sulfatase-like hydrolase/transferase [Proteobacteria bacterium]|nr:sulfatase-like hydrolase/transferase [Pseudomonadota bacterium]